jgi:hypothetical protein
MASKNEVLNALDHPIVFTFLLALVVAAWLALITWGAKAVGLPGLAAFAQHP